MFWKLKLSLQPFDRVDFDVEGFVVRRVPHPCVLGKGGQGEACGESFFQFDRVIVGHAVSDLTASRGTAQSPIAITDPPVSFPQPSM